MTKHLLAIACGLLLSCEPSATCEEWPLPDPRVFAYRGGGALAPENTVVAAERAVADGADGIELDVRRTADGILIAFHDPTTGRTSDDVTNRPVSMLTYAQLQALDVGGWFAPEYAGTRVPTLDEMIAAIPPDREMIFDLKVDEVVAPVAKLIQERGLGGRSLVSSFEIDRLAAFHELAPEVRLGYCLETWEDIDRAPELPVEFVRLPWYIEDELAPQREVLDLGYSLVVTDAAKTPLATMIVAADVPTTRTTITGWDHESCE